MLSRVAVRFASAQRRGGSVGLGVGIGSLVGEAGEVGEGNGCRATSRSRAAV